MGALIFQHVYFGRITRKLWFLLMVSFAWAEALDETGDKTFNLKIGFDLTHGAHGASSLRIRNFEENDPVINDDVVRYKPALRAGPASSSDENEKKKHQDASRVLEMKAVEESGPSDDDDSDVSDYDRKQRSTKGLRADEYEPDANAFDHEKIDIDSESGGSP